MKRHNDNPPTPPEQEAHGFEPRAVAIFLRQDFGKEGSAASFPGSTPAGHRDHGPQAGESCYGLLMLLMILYGGRYIGL